MISLYPTEEDLSEEVLGNRTGKSQKCVLKATFFGQTLYKLYRPSRTFSMRLKYYKRQSTSTFLQYKEGSRLVNHAINLKRS